MSHPPRTARLPLILALASALATPSRAQENDQVTPPEPPTANQPLEARPWVAIRGVYGGFPQTLVDQGGTLKEAGINAVWVGSGSLSPELVARCREQGVKLFAEFNSMHFAEYLKDHPEAAPIGLEGQPEPAPDGWQGVSAHDPGYRANRMAEFRRVLTEHEIDGIWLDYHHAHAAWERDDPILPDTDFSPTALLEFQKATGVRLPRLLTPQLSRFILRNHRDAWIQWRCDVFTDWVREYKAIRDEVRPRALLGTFHCPWGPEERDDAIRAKLAIDLKAQAAYLDVFSIMPYHARFGHADDPAWIARQTERLGRSLNLKGAPDEKIKIWPIVQLADWGQPVTPEQVAPVIEFGTRRPATGVMVFHWSGLDKSPAKRDALSAAYRALAGCSGRP